MRIGVFTTPIGKNAVDSYDIFETTNKLNISLYPNPANQQVVLQLAEVANFDEVATQKTVKITDMLGRTVQVFETNESQMTLDLSNFANGSYFVSVNNGSETATEKLLLIR